MTNESSSVTINRANWDERVPMHTASPDYAVDRFRTDPEFLSEVVRFDLPRLGSVAGLRGVHLQCHIGTDTLSLARRGATMTGLDFSPAAVRQARDLAEATGTAVDFVESELYRAGEVLPANAFDLVYTGIGALCWLPDVQRWAEVVASLLRPGGRLFLREGHPMMWAIDDRIDDRLEIGYPYFETAEPLAFEDSGTYVETEQQLANTLTHSWNHGIGEIITALLDHGMTLTQFVEHDSVPWEAFPGQMSRTEFGEWRLTDRPERVAHSYTLQAVKAD